MVAPNRDQAQFVAPNRDQARFVVTNRGQPFAQSMIFNRTPLIRDINNHDYPTPHYDLYNLAASVMIRHGGSVTDSPDYPQYIGGSVRIIDYVTPNHVSIFGLSKLCEEVGIPGKKSYFIEGDDGVLKMVTKDEDLKYAFIQICRSKDTEMFELYVVSTNDGAVEDEEGLEYFSESDYDGLSDNDVAAALEVGDPIEPQPARNVPARTKYVEGESDSGDDDIVVEGDELNSDRDSDEESRKKGKVKFVIFNEVDVFKPKFTLGMKFVSKKLFRAAVQSHAINTQRQLLVKKSDPTRMHAKCLGVAGCPWRLHVAYLPEDKCFVVRDYLEKHKCAPTMKVKSVKSKWLARRFLHHFKNDAKRNIKGWTLDVIRVLMCDVSKQQGYRSRAEALELLHGKPSDQYKWLWDYLDEVHRTNPGSTLVMETEHFQGADIFDRLYICLGALKQGFKSGCRPVLGIDGCHLKGPYGGCLLTAVAIDANNNTFPVAWAAVEKETNDTWLWFLNLVKKDLNTVKEQDWTIMSDKQKGLIQAVGEIFPGCEHRFCVRHLHGNFKSAGFTGDLLKLALWSAARACTVEEYDEVMEALTELEPAAAFWFADKPPNQWSKSHFRTYPKCDILLNNGCECFNSCIGEAREKGILAMLEWLMEYSMRRMQINRDRARKSWPETEKICPKIRKIILNQMEHGHMRELTPLKADDTHYMVDDGRGGRFEVDLAQWTCGCRRWDLSGIPCVHALRAIGAQGLILDDYVHQCYYVSTYKSIYAPVVMPTNGRALWKKSQMPPPLPPRIAIPVGRPKKGARRPEADERVNKTVKRCRGKPLGLSKKNPNKLKKMQRTCKCKFCGEPGHNSKGCNKKKEYLRNPPPAVDVQMEGQTDASNVLLNVIVNDGAGQQAQVGDVCQQTVVDDAGQPDMFSQVCTPVTQPANLSVVENDHGAGTSKQKLPVKRKANHKSVSSGSRPVANKPFRPPSAARKPRNPVSFESMSLNEALMRSIAAENAQAPAAPSFESMTHEQPLPRKGPVLMTSPSMLQQVLQGQGFDKITESQSVGSVNLLAVQFVYKWDQVQKEKRKRRIPLSDVGGCWWFSSFMV